MIQEDYSKAMKFHQEEFDKLWKKIVKDTNEFIKDNPEKRIDEMKDIENFADDIILSGAWIYDRINDINFHSKKGIRFKIRKVLGYTYP